MISMTNFQGELTELALAKTPRTPVTTAAAWLQPNEKLTAFATVGI